MTELRVGHERTVYEQGAADPGTDRQQKDGATHAFARPVRYLRQARGVGVVDDHHVTPDGTPYLVRGGPSDPAGIDVGGRGQASFADHAREAASDGQIGGDLGAGQHSTDDRSDRRRHRFWPGRLRRLLAHAGSDELRRGQVDQACLDAGASHVDAQRKTLEPGPGGRTPCAAVLDRRSGHRG